MPHLKATFAVALTAALLLPASAAMAAAPGDAAKVKPSQVQAIEGSKLRRIILTQKAADRLDIQTGVISEEPADGKIAPYASIFYDLRGAAWVYTIPAPLTYVRHGVVIKHIKGENAYLEDGPATGAQVVTVGSAHLYGTEKGVGH